MGEKIDRIKLFRKNVFCQKIKFLVYVENFKPQLRSEVLRQRAEKCYRFIFLEYINLK